MREARFRGPSPPMCHRARPLKTATWAGRPHAVLCDIDHPGHVEATIGDSCLAAARHARQPLHPRQVAGIGGTRDCRSAHFADDDPFFLFAVHLASQQVGPLVGRGLPLVCTASSCLWSPGLLPGLACARTLATAGSSGKADQPKDKASGTASQACGGFGVRESHVLATAGDVQRCSCAAAPQDLVTSEEEFDAITDKIPQRPVGIVEGTSYSLIILAALGVG